MNIVIESKDIQTQKRKIHTVFRTENNVRGYKVTTTFHPVDEEGKKAKNKAIVQTIMGALRRMRG